MIYINDIFLVAFLDHFYSILYEDLGLIICLTIYPS